MLGTIKSSIFFVFRVLVLYLLFFYAYAAGDHAENRNSEQKEFRSLVHIGVVLDLDSPFGNMVDLCIDMAISDFYSAHPNYTTRLQLLKRNAKDVIDVNFAVLELLKHGVLGILGPQGPSQDNFVAALGEKVRVPILSFTARSSPLAYAENRYFVRQTQDDTVQARALADICHRFQWPEVVILYENTEYGNQFLSYLSDAFQDVDIGMACMTPIHTSADDSYVLNELNKLTTKQTKVFLVHMSPLLGYRLLHLANTAGMMSEGYAWIITDSLSVFLSSVDSALIRDSIDGVLGIRPYIFSSKKLDDFQEKWKRNAFLKKNTDPVMELNAYGLWAYDTVTALTMAVENIGPVNSSLQYVDGVINTGLRISSYGPMLLSELSSTKFEGLIGEFQFVEGKLKPATFEIFNVRGNGEKTVGFWKPDGGVIRELASSGGPMYTTSNKELKRIVWPGDSVIQPKGWMIPANGKLRVGIPWTSGFTEFVKVTIDPATNHTDASGFSVDIFLEAKQRLPFHIDHEFHCYNDTTHSNWSYDNMLKRIPQDYDMIVADTTIWSPRTAYVDFSLPYSESGVVLVVKTDRPFNMLFFVRPLRWDLWLAILVSCILMGIVLHILERRVTNGTGEEPVRPHNRRPGAIYLSPIAVLAFQERNMVSNKWSVFVLVCWLFVAFILMQSFTANLSSMLTVDQLQFAFSGSYYVGYQEASLMKDFLTDQLHIDAAKLRSYATTEQYHRAMSLGGERGGVDVIFDEIPYMKLFMKRYEFQYKIVGPTYRTSGFGFAFPIGSSLVAYFSRAILNVTQGPTMSHLETKNFGPGYSSQDPLSTSVSQGTPSLTFPEFAGLFVIAGSLILFAIFCSETAVGQKFTEMTERFFQNHFGSNTTQVHSVEGIVVAGDAGSGDEASALAQNSSNPRRREGKRVQLAEETYRQDDDGDDEEIVETNLNGSEATVVEDAVGLTAEDQAGETPGIQLSERSA